MTPTPAPTQIVQGLTAISGAAALPAGTLELPYADVMGVAVAIFAYVTALTAAVRYFQTDHRVTVGFAYLPPTALFVTASVAFLALHYPRTGMVSWLPPLNAAIGVLGVLCTYSLVAPVAIAFPAITRAVTHDRLLSQDLVQRIMTDEAVQRAIRDTARDRSWRGTALGRLAKRLFR